MVRFTFVKESDRTCKTTIAAKTGSTFGERKSIIKTLPACQEKKGDE
jgi:hypothetical protein